MTSLTRANSTGSDAARNSDLTWCTAKPGIFFGHRAPSLGLYLDCLRICHDDSPLPFAILDRCHDP